MDYFKKIVCTLFALEFIGVSIFTIMMVPEEFVSGRIAMFIFTALILVGVTVVALFYDEKTDSFRWKK